MVRKKLAGLIMAAVIATGSTVYASTEINENSVQTDLVHRIRAAEMVDNPEAQPVKESLQERINKIMQASTVAPAQKQVESNLPKVAVMYVNNSKSTYDDEVDKQIFKYLNKAIPEDTYELVDGSPYVEMLNKAGYMDISTAERSDFLDAYSDSGIDYVIYLEVQPFIARDKVTFFTVGKDITTTVPLKIINLGTGKYIYNGKFTEKASDSTVIGMIGNKSVAMKVLDNIGEKIMAELQIRLPKEKAAPAATAVPTK